MGVGEPFRVFFPLGLLAGMIGLALWPLFFWGAWKSYPLLVHARLMVEGFFGAFIIGFLGTAAPRLLGAPPFRAGEVGSLLVFYLAALTLHLAGKTLLGDVLFLTLLLAFLATLGLRFAHRTELPPPNFLLVGAGLLSAVLGLATILAANLLPSYAHCMVPGGLLLNQGFVLLPILGVGVFLFPRFLGNPLDGARDELRRPTPHWRRKAWLAAGVVALIALSFVVESSGFTRLGAALRGATAAGYLASQVPGLFAWQRGVTLTNSLRVGVWLLCAGLLWPVFLPLYRVAGLHLLFMGGFMVITFTVGARVIFGHSGQAHLFAKRLPFLVTTLALLLIAMLSRIGADFAPGSRTRHLIYASVLGIAAAFVWGVRLIPRLFVPDDE